ncbi:unnamed protein product [Larinioides sclopetarius]|uniref:MADF domain-containing protein n=1 Tax=Larinioides sclopetarius TaxID=280406 RepID=A0AAV2BKA7_9ARAC
MISNRQFIVEVIQLYKQLPCLWKRTDLDYCDKNKREVAMEQLVDLFRTKYANADKDLVQKKITSLRGSYRKEYNKDCDEDSSESTNVPVNQKMEQIKIECEDDSNESADEPSASSSDTRWLQDSSPSRIKSQRFKWPKYRSRAEKVLDKISRKMDLSLEKQLVIKRKHDSFGEYLAEKLRSLEPNMAIYCQKIINDAIFLAETDNLNISSKIVTSLSNSTDMNSVTSEYVSDLETCFAHLE